MKHKLKSRFLGELSITSDIQMTPTLQQKAKRNQRSSWWKWKSRVKKTDLKLNIKKLRSWHPVPSLHGKLMGNNGNSDRLYFLGSKITADDDCSHEIKRCLLLGWKAMINLDSVSRSRDITLLTKVRTVKTTVLPVVMYGCESWTIKKAGHQRTDAFEIWFWRRLLSPLDCKEIKPVNLKGNSEYSLEGLMLKLKLQYCGHLVHRADSLEKALMLRNIKGRRRSGWQRMRRLDGITDSMDMSLSRLWEMVKDMEGWHASVHGVTKNQAWLSDWTITVT